MTPTFIPLNPSRANRVVLTSLATLSLTALGCGGAEEEVLEKRPRPVSIQVLSSSAPPKAAFVTASVGSWKQEDIGFEIGGRVEFVVEQNTEIEGRLTEAASGSATTSTDSLKQRIQQQFGDQFGEEPYFSILSELLQESSNVVIPGTPIGRLESERYELQFQRALAEVRQAQNTLEAGLVDLKDGIPAQIAAVEATKKLAKTQLDRSNQLVARKSAPQSDADKAQADFDKAVADEKRLKAQAMAKEAEVEGLKAAVLQAKQGLKDAYRDLNDCVLYSSFTGQISNVAVVPGSVVAAGQSVATLQMMDPIKVELEVSAEDSRRLRSKEHLPVVVKLPDGSSETLEGFLYLIDPAADPLTRTFTITLLVLNRKLSSATIEEGVARTAQTWRLDFSFLPGAEDGKLFIAKGAICSDEQGDYLWAITNATIGSGLPADGQLKVRRLPVTLGTKEIPFLGNWVFQEVIVNDEEFDGAKNLVAGELIGETDGEESWKGDIIQLDPGSQWLLRPGDLVDIDLSGQAQSDGFFVPMDAIVKDSDGSSIFRVDDSQTPAVVQKLPIELVEQDSGAATSGLRRIRAAGDESLEGITYVTGGVHYLIDGESVRVTTGEDSE